MLKTKLVPITSLDQLEVGSVIVDKAGAKFKILAKCGLLVFISYHEDHNKSWTDFTIRGIQEKGFQLEVTEEPWRPNDGEGYFMPNVIEGEPRVIKLYYTDTSCNQQRTKAGLACETEEEALAKAQKMLDSIKDSE